MISETGAGSSLGGREGEAGVGVPGPRHREEGWGKSGKEFPGLGAWRRGGESLRSVAGS